MSKKQKQRHQPVFLTVSYSQRIDRLGTLRGPILSIKWNNVYCLFLPFWVDIARNLYWRALEFWRAFRIWRALPWSARRSREIDILASLAAFYLCGEVQGFHCRNLGRQRGNILAGVANLALQASRI